MRSGSARLGGAAAGGAIGSTVGGGRGNTLAIVGSALGGSALGNQVVDKPIQQQQAQAEASRDQAMQRQLDYERQSALQQEQVRRKIQEQQLFDEWKRERLGEPFASSS